MGRPSPGPIRPADESAAETDRPVTHGELRTLRRWVVVAGVWAVAATAVALIALLDDSGRAADRRANQTGERVARSERRIDARLDRIESRLGALPSSAQVTRLQQQAGQAQRAASGARTDLDALEKRVSELERASSQPTPGGDGDSGSGSGGDDGPSLRDLLP